MEKNAGDRLAGGGAALAAERGHDGVGLAGDVAAGGRRERAGSSAPGSAGWPGLVGLCLAVPARQAVSRSESCSSAGGERLARSAACSRCNCPGRSEISVSVGAGGDLDGLGLGAVPGHRPELVGVGAHHVGQDVPVALVALSPGRAVRSRDRDTCRGLIA